MNEDNTFEDMKNIAEKATQVAEECVQSMQRILEVSEYYDRRSAQRFKWMVIICIVAVIIALASMISSGTSFHKKRSAQLLKNEAMDIISASRAITNVQNSR